MGNWIFFITTLIYLFTFAVVFKMSGSSNSKYTLGVTLKDDQKKDVAVLAILKKYRLHYKVWLMMSFLCALPFLLRAYYFSLQFSYLILYFIGVPVSMLVVQMKGNQALKALKHLKGWQDKVKSITQVDTRVSRQKINAIPGIEWYVLSLMLGCVPLMIAVEATRGLSYFVVALTFLTTFLFYGLHHYTKRSKNEVVSTDSDVNMSQNTYRKRLLLWMWASLSVYSAILNIGIFFSIRFAFEMQNLWWFLLLPLTSVPILGLALGVHQKILHKQAEVGDSPHTLWVDEDDYWIGGVFYHNPKNPKWLVNRRDGLGSTINTGTRGGKRAVVALILLVTLTLGPIWIGAIMDDVVPPRVTWGESDLQIKSGLYRSTFAYSDIERITSADEIGKGMKINGTATDRFYRGHFSMNRFGKSDLFVFKDVKPFIVITLKDKTIIYNAMTTEETLAFERQLKAIIGF